VFGVVTVTSEAGHMSCHRLRWIIALADQVGTVSLRTARMLTRHARRAKRDQKTGSSGGGTCVLCVLFEALGASQPGGNGPGTSLVPRCERGKIRQTKIGSAYRWATGRAMFARVERMLGPAGSESKRTREESAARPALGQLTRTKVSVASSTHAGEGQHPDST
jgi:hypothetical protein